MAAETLAYELEKATRMAASDVVPWFLEQMPKSYFNNVHYDARVRHLRAIAAHHETGQPLSEIQIRGKDEMTFITGASSAKRNLYDALTDVPQEENISRVRIFTARDHSVKLYNLKFGQQERYTGTNDGEREARAELMSYLSRLQAGEFAGDPLHAEPSPIFSEEAVDEYLTKCGSAYVQRSSPRRFVDQMAKFAAVKGTEDVAVSMEGWPAVEGGKNPRMITIAASNVLPKLALQRSALYLTQFGFDVRRCHLDVVDDPGNGMVTMMRILLVEPLDSPDVVLDEERFLTEIQNLKWLDDRDILMAVNNSHITVTQAEVIGALLRLVHCPLAKENPFAFAVSRMREIVLREQHLMHARAIADLFLDRFNPDAPLSNADFATRQADIKQAIHNSVESWDSELLLLTMLTGVEKTLRTNAYLPGRYGMALRVDPSLLGHGLVGTDIPFGAFFVHGRRFNAFHVRFRDIARGGLRVVTPSTTDHYTAESVRHYDECYSLAFAQQLKNKDIPEGGSKAVILVEPYVLGAGPTHHHYTVRRSVKSFSDCLLDLNSTHEHVKERVVDHYGKDELIYLGPDEQIIPEDIEWVIKRAKVRGYPCPNAFMSSKPAAGINHKVYGVTSEGVAVFLETALKATGIDPHTQPFTVKLTGGTDGDVAGNMIKIMARDYGDNVKVVGMCDGTATIEDPEGIDMQELLRMFHEALPLSDFAGTLSSEGRMLKADTPEGIRARNTMHNRVKADAFVPAGGRPATVHEGNWREFLLPDGTPSSPLVVEGANLFITPAARQKLFDEAGVVVVKDSSANKCGVVCSSYEIMSSMLLSEDEFLACKDEIVDDVLVKLRGLARVEAQLMFREYAKNPDKSLPPTSERISRCITRVHDAVSAALDDVDGDGQGIERRAVLKRLVAEHLPEKLCELALDRMEERVPWPYINNVMSCSIASKLVYNEGLTYVEGLPDISLVDIAVRYAKQEERTRFLSQMVRDTDMEESEEVVDLLMRGGIRAGVEKV